MNTFTETIWPEVRAHTWKYALRGTPMQGAVVHATRSAQPGFTSKQDYNACKSWYKSPANRTVDSAGKIAAAFTHAIVGDGGKFCICLPDEYYPRWSAGHFDLGGFWSVEIAQATNDTPFDPLDVERAEHEIAKKARQHDWDPKYIEYMHGDNREGEGVGFHDASRNGDLLGKSDPGDQPPFNNRPLFVARIRARWSGIEIPDIGPTPQPGGIDVPTQHNRLAKWGSTPGGWRGKSISGVVVVQARKDLELPACSAVDIDLRISPGAGAFVQVEGAPGQFADVLDAKKTRDIITVPVAPDGTIRFVCTGTSRIEEFGSVRVWA